MAGDWSSPHKSLSTRTPFPRFRGDIWAFKPSDLSLFFSGANSKRGADDEYI
ncbi:hypothetical protein BDV25DRAFT_163540, partial [Aspergillus avenaceus]